MSCDQPDCGKPVEWRAYASYNADHGENVHPRHARYPMPMVRACSEHLAALLAADGDTPGATRQFVLVHLPSALSVAPEAPDRVSDDCVPGTSERYDEATT